MFCLSFENSEIDLLEQIMVCQQHIELVEEGMEEEQSYSHYLIQQQLQYDFMVMEFCRQ